MNSSAREASGRAPVALVTGAAGFLGSHLVRRLAAAGHTVHAVIRPASDAWRLRELPPSVHVLPIDVGNLGSPENVRRFDRVEWLFHLAATGVDPSRSNPATLVEVNVGGTVAALKLADSLGVQRFVYCGSCFEYGDRSRAREADLPRPTTDYAATKAAGWLLAEAAARRTGLPVVSLRPFTAYGPFEAPNRLVPSAVLAGLTGNSLPLTAGAQTRDFVYVEEAIDAFLRAATVDEAVGQTLNVCTGAETTIREVVEMIAELTGNSLRPQFGAREYRPGEMWSSSGDPTSTERILGWRASVSLREGMVRTIEWFRAYRERFDVYAREAVRG